ncbi:RraA family protein, partial [Micromonospora sp. NPDC005113]
AENGWAGVVINGAVRDVAAPGQTGGRSGEAPARR